MKIITEEMRFRKRLCEFALKNGEMYHINCNTTNKNKKNRKRYILFYFFMI